MVFAVVVMLGNDAVELLVMVQAPIVSKVAYNVFQDTKRPLDIVQSKDTRVVNHYWCNNKLRSNSALSYYS